MDHGARDEYIRAIDNGLAPLVRRLDQVILAAHPELNVGIRYCMLTYAIEGEFRWWICAIDARKETVCLRFLFGTRLVAQPGKLRPGSTTMGTLDLTSIKEINSGLVADLVDQAVRRLDEFKASHRKR